MSTSPPPAPSQPSGKFQHGAMLLVLVVTAAVTGLFAWKAAQQYQGLSQQLYRVGLPYLMVLAILALIHHAYFRSVRELLRKRTAQMLALIDPVEVERRRLASEKAALEAQQEQLQAEVNRRSDELSQAQRMATVGRLAAGIAHELNTPLGTIAACSEGLLERLADRDPLDDTMRETLQEYLEVIEEETFRCKEITGSVLDFARSTPARLEAVNPFDLLEPSLYGLRLRYGDAVQLQIEAPDEEETILADPGQLRQVLLNVTKNAIDAIDGSGSVTWAGRWLEGGVELTCRDDGRGLSPQELRHIWDPYFSTKDAGQGTGLGLPLSHRLVSSHGGVIGISSKGHGQGAEVTIRLPTEAVPDRQPELVRVVRLHEVMLEQVEAGRFGEAVSTATQALELRQQLLGEAHPHVATSCLNLAILQLKAGDLAAARAAAEQALSLRAGTGPDGADLAQPLDVLAHILQEQGDPAAALEPSQRALVLRERLLGPDHVETASNLHTVGLLAERSDNLELAARSFEGAARSFEEATGIQADGVRVLVARSLDGLARVKEVQGDAAGAREALERALSLREQRLRGNDPVLAATFTRVARHRVEAREEEAAIPLFEKALAVRRQAHGTDHFETAVALNNLGTCLAKLGRSWAARERLEEAVAICERMEQPIDPRTAHCANALAVVCYQQGEVGRATGLLARAVQICEETLGPDHPETRLAHANLADVRMVGVIGTSPAVPPGGSS